MPVSSAFAKSYTGNNLMVKTANKAPALIATGFHFSGPLLNWRDPVREGALTC